GASRLGIMQMFLGYGLAIGIVGSVLGLVIAVSIVTNLNEIQELIAQTTGWRMWNPQTYFFDRIPDKVDYAEAWWAVAGAVVSSVIGATLPALLAGRLKPVEALRYE
ncbi:MAG: FtsX-like permease family protein, partial [Planctomycetota bacterium]